MLLISSPLEDFTVYSKISIFFNLPFFIDFSLSNSSFSLISATFVIALFCFISNFNNKLIPNFWQLCFLKFNSNVQFISREHLGPNNPFSILIFTLFTLLLVINHLGFIPFVFCATTQLIIAIGLSLSIWFGVILFGIWNQGFNFFAHFLPAGTPMILSLLLIPIELISFTARAMSLGLRLAINLSTGHLLNIIISEFAQKFLIAGFSSQQITTKFLIFLSAFAPILLILVLSILEIGLLFLQAFIFATLTAIYFAEVTHSH